MLIKFNRPILHRVNGPTKVWPDKPGLEVWYLHNVIHRYYGPASIGSYFDIPETKNPRWFIHGGKIK